MSNNFRKYWKIDFILSLRQLGAFYFLTLRILHVFFNLINILIFYCLGTFVIVLRIQKVCWKPVFRVSLFRIIRCEIHLLFLKLRIDNLILISFIFECCNRKQLLDYPIFLMLSQLVKMPFVLNIFNKLIIWIIRYSALIATNSMLSRLKCFMLNLRSLSSLFTHFLLLIAKILLYDKLWRLCFEVIFSLWRFFRLLLLPFWTVIFSLHNGR